MSSMYVSRLRACICTLKDGESVVDAELDKELGELISVGASFSLNSIPTMQISVPLGTSLNSGAAVRGSYAYYSDIQKAFTERKPVGVFLESSDRIPGVPIGRVWLFKGYIAAASSSFGPGAGALQLTLTHWLQDMDTFAVLNRLSSPDNGADLSQNPIFKTDNPRAGDAIVARDLKAPNWIVSDGIEKAFRDNPTDIFEAIRTGFEPVLQEGEDLNEKAVGRLPKNSIARLRSAFNAMTSRYLDFWDPISPAQDVAFREALIKTFNAQRSSDYYSVTLWKKLLQMLTSYYICVSPSVKEVSVIPAPGMRMNDEKAFTIPTSRVTGLRVHKTGKSMLGGVILADSARTMINGFTPVAAERPSYHMYPERPEPGFIKVCFMPPWLAQVMLQESSKLQPPVHYFYKEHAVEEFIARRRQLRADKTGHAALCDAYVKSVYLSEITREHTASLTMPLNLDLVPGDVVKVEVPRDRIQNLRREYLYATIASVSYTISGGTASSSYTLTNLRDEALMKKFESPHALLYADGWRDNDDTDTRLYAKMED